MQRLQQASVLLIDADTGRTLRTIALQFNPDSLTRSLQPRGAGEDTGPSQAMRLHGPPVETIKVDVELDAADQIQGGMPANGIHGQLAALEAILYPSVEQLTQTDALARQGILEIAPAPGPLTVFSWDKSRLVPVRITDLSITEEAFDADLNPIRAKVSLSMQVLSVNDLGFSSKAARMYLSYQRQKEKFAQGAK